MKRNKRHTFMKQVSKYMLTLSLMGGILFYTTGCFGYVDKSKEEAYEVYNEEQVVEADVLSLYNGIGNITITPSDDDKVKVVANLIRNKDIKNFDEKKQNLLIQPQLEDGVLFIEPLALDGTTNYWEWLAKDLNTEGVYIDFEVQVPDSMKEVRTFCEIGNIKVKGLKNKLDIRNHIGKISGEKIEPIEEAIFYTDIGKIDVTLNDIAYTKQIIAGTDIGKVQIRVPDSQPYQTIESEKVVDQYGNGGDIEFDRTQAKAPYKKGNNEKVKVTNIMISEKQPFNRISII